MILMTHHETSTGMLNQIDKIGKLANKYKLIFVVDAVSSIGAENISMEDYYIDFLTGTSDKALAGFPGFSFIVGKVRILEKLKEVKINSQYLNLWKYYYYIKYFNQTPNTPSIFSFIILDEILKKILKKYEKLKRNGFIGKIKYFFDFNKTIFFIDEGEFVFFTVIGLIFNILEIIIWIFAISQFLISFYRFFQRAMQVKNNSKELFKFLRK